MKGISRTFLFTLLLTALLISACGGASSTREESSVGSGKPMASLVEFTGVIESMSGDQWVVNGQTFTVDASALRDGTFEVGDTVKVEVEVQTDGSILVTRVESPALTPDSDDLSGGENPNGGEAPNLLDGIAGVNDNSSNIDSNDDINDDSDDDINDDSDDDSDDDSNDDSGDDSNDDDN